MSLDEQSRRQYYWRKVHKNFSIMPLSKFLIIYVREQNALTRAYTKHWTAMCLPFDCTAHQQKMRKQKAKNKTKMFLYYALLKTKIRKTYATAKNKKKNPQKDRAQEIIRRSGIKKKVITVVRPYLFLAQQSKTVMNGIDQSVEGCSHAHAVVICSRA